MELVLIRLVNNDRIMGMVLHNSAGMVILYSPMSLTIRDDQVFSEPYDVLSNSCLAIFHVRHILTMTSPKKNLVDQYHSTASEYYPSFEEYKESMDLAEDDEEEFDEEKLKKMFSEFSKIDKNKLN